ncbi:hypothetical protein [Silvibacterium acidisoli]|uniref:hypothetical protein n=1 Tax=Acidobacteriaceae bacterium ZG23-2 TaxID=2883246 RepID=UPI00406D2706
MRTGFQELTVHRILAFVAVLALFAVAPHAHAEADRVSYFHDITIGEGEQADDAVCLFCSIRNDGEIRSDAVTILGSVHSNGQISGDAVSILGSLRLGEDAHVGGDSVAVLGQLRYRSGQIGGEAVELPVVLALIPLALLALLVWAIRALVRGSRSPYSMPRWR